jgi:hypothetical protein
LDALFAPGRKEVEFQTRAIATDLLHENAIVFPLCSKFACDQAPEVRPRERDERAAQISNVFAPLKLHEQCDHVTAHVKEDLFSKACHLTTVMMEDNGSRLVTTLRSMREYPMPKFGIFRAPGLSYTEPFVEQSDTIKDGAAERHASSRSNLPYGTPDSLVQLEEVTIEDNRPVSTSKRPTLLEEHLSLCLKFRRQNHPCD